ncbi:class I SAM-dependent methyltransferase [Streptomyces sp. I05A-00742]|uniref:class I SAM-dependent methyltransferase n=1 Tax=Streptomyces sp. I05A-00742 TaxID=2732853 RepID=UPI002896AA18|nr:class I SAM-dependent methyltransferase [Streptomyces sp. I05A-00742]
MVIEDPATYWDQLWTDGARYRPLDETETTALEQHAGAGEGRAALDIGSGDGSLAHHLARLGYTTIGIDCAPAAVGLAAETGATGVTFREADIEGPEPLPAPEQPFALITARLVYAFIADKPSFLRRVRHLLSDDGLFWVVSPLADRLREDRAGIGITADDEILLTGGWSKVHMTDLDIMRCYALRP